MRSLQNDPGEDASYDFGGDDDDDDDDSSSVIDISEFLTESTIAAATRTTDDMLDDKHPNGNGDPEQPPSWNDKSKEEIETAITEKTSDASTLVSQQNRKGRSFRIVMGDSVLRWRKIHRESASKSGNQLMVDIEDSNYNTAESAKQPQEFATLRQRNMESGLNGINWEDSILKVSESGAQLYSKTTHEKNKAALHETNDRETTAAELASFNITNPLSSGKFMDVVAIWDRSRQEYRLEIPKLIAIEDQARKIMDKPLGWLPTNDTELATVDPLMQSRQAEEALKKRKKGSKNTARRPTKRTKTIRRVTSSK